jgi:putative peptide zinc metalloprotease protein
MKMNQLELLSHRDEAAERAAETQQGQPTAAAGDGRLPAVPDRPVLAPNVQLVGEMRGTGFKDRQWLMQRDGRFIQVTEFLYRVAEQANGQRTLEEIARGLTQSTDWIVDADHVRQLIQTKLIPLGLVATAEGSVASRGGTAGEDRVAADRPPRSPLAVNMRLKALSPRIIDPIARVLQVLYAPPILIPIVIAAAIAHAWLYHVHGVAESIRDTLYTPGGLLLVLAIVIMAAIFHEFGHASALRYGGGKVRGMGAGIYLIYPVFYTDVTDSYRLGRWARVRTDLGGVYFHLIFALGLIALSIVSGKEFLLFAVLLINLEIISQFLPLVRLDGYWMLADLTGIPDFFSQMGPFLRSVRPVPGLKGSKLPSLKPWVAAVFAFYITATVPLLAYLFFLMVRGLPRFLATTRDAFLAQTRLFSIVWSQGDLFIMVLSVLQMLLLALPVLGTLYILYSVSRIPIMAVWDWSKPTATRRMAGALGAAAVTALVGLLWAPQLRGLTGSAAVPMQTVGTNSLLQQTRAATAKLRTLRADLEGSLGPDHFSGTVLLKRPNLARIEVKGEGHLEFVVVSDGRKLVVYFPGDNRYTQSDPGPEGRNIQAFVAEQIHHFFRPDSIGRLSAGGRSSYVGKEMADGTEYEVIEVVAPAPQNQTTRYFISPENHLIHRVVTTTKVKSGETATTSANLKNLRTNAPVEESVFRWTPPPTAGPLQLPSGITLPIGNGVSK